MWLLDEIAEKAGSPGSGLALGAGVSTITVCGVYLHDWVYILTIIVLLVNIVKFGFKAIQKLRSLYVR